MQSAKRGCREKLDSSITKTVVQADQTRHAYTHAYTHAYMHAYTQVYTHAYTQAYTRTRTLTHAHNVIKELLQFCFISIETGTLSFVDLKWSKMIAS